MKRDLTRRRLRLVSPVPMTTNPPTQSLPERSAAPRSMFRFVTVPKAHVHALLPRTPNNSVQEFSPWLVRAFEALLRCLAGGLSEDADIQGQWHSPNGELCRDRNRHYFIQIAPDDAGLVVLLLKHVICTTFKQTEAFVWEVPVITYEKILTAAPPSQHSRQSIEQKEID